MKSSSDAVPFDLEAALANIRSSPPDQALAILRDLFRRHPEHLEATRLLGAILEKQGDSSWQHRATVLSRALHGPELLLGARLLNENKLPEAEAILRPYLKDQPSDPAAHFLMADLAMRCGHADDAETLLLEALRLAPSYATARFKLAQLLFDENRLADALEQFDILLTDYPGDVRVIDLKARTFNRLGRVDEATALHERLVALEPRNARMWAHYGHSLRFLGRQEDSVAAYRTALELDGTLAPVWWSLANLKTIPLTDDDIDRIVADLAKDDVDSNNRAHLHFAVAKAVEDRGLPREAFAHYVEGNALRRAESKHDSQWISRLVRHAATDFDRQFFADRSGWGVANDGPIFVVGMPRAGSTLVEQILASHPQVEGLAELPYVAILSRQHGEHAGQGYPEFLAKLGQAESAELGQRYLDLVAPHRLSDRPFFVDKNPNNWLVLDFIHLILPNCKIVDVRRHPLDCGISNFRQLFADSQEYSYSLGQIGEYYREYVAMLQRVDEVLPGRVHRVIYEQLVDNPRQYVERLLEFLGLPFDETCMQFHANPRAVRTPSSEQVRRPINREGVEHWRKFERWIGPLRDALGSVLDAYPGVPADLKNCGESPDAHLRDVPSLAGR